MKTRPRYLNKHSIAINSNVSADQVESDFIKRQLPKAIVIGAGPAGLASAIDLRKQGYDVLVIEKRGAFTRSNVIGINRMALPWFEKHELIDELLENSHKTANYPVTIDSVGSMLNTNLWLADAASTTNTIAIKTLQKMLLDEYVKVRAPGNSYILTESTVEINANNSLTIVADREIQVDLNQINIVIVADGSQSQTRQQLHSLFEGATSRDLNVIENIPTQQFANIIVDAKPEALKPGVYLHKDADTGLAMAFSVSDEEISINFQTLQSQQADNHVIIGSLIEEAHLHLTKFISKLNESQGLAMQVNRDALYYPIHGGKLTHGFSIHSVINEEMTRSMHHVIFDTPSTYATQTVFDDRFVLVGDTKGTSSPMAGLGASLALALDPSVIASVADDLKQADRAVTSVAFKNISIKLQASIATWVKKAIAKLQINVELEIVGAHLVAKNKAIVKAAPVLDGNRLFTHAPAMPLMQKLEIRAAR